ncbi:MAG: SPOR domain-containing protein [Blastomonas sp.]
MNETDNNLPGDGEIEANEPQVEQELGLEEEERLPWLESAEDYGEDESSTGRVLGFILLGLLALALIVGGIYWLQNRNGMAEGDGSTIAAPDGDYKVAPEDAQATEVEGTGDASFAASEGQKTEGQLAGSGSAPVAEGSVLVQLGAFSTEAAANSGWTDMARRFDYVGGLSKKVTQAQVDGGTVYRLSAVAPNANAANVVCDRLKKAGENCLVIR